VRLLLVTHAVVLAAEPVAAEGALELAVARVHDVVTLQVLARGKPLRALESILGISFGTKFTNKNF
jgi:hypothetical protein